MLLQRKAAQFLTDGLATTTRATYATGQQRFAAFCQTIHAYPVPASEHTLILFATHLATSNIAHTTIKVYISAIRHMHVSAGLHAEFNSQLTPRLQLTLKGIQRNQATSHPPRVRLPITLQIMQSINDLLTNQPLSYTNILIWAACCLAFFGFLRVKH